MSEWVYCPYCGFGGPESEVDDHRLTHNDEPQQGSNLGGRH